MIKRFLPHISVGRLGSWHALIGTLLAGFVAILLLLHLVNPLEIGPNGILAFFLVLYATTIVLVLLAMKAARHLRGWRFTPIKSMYIAAIVAFGPVMLLALNTLGQLGILDVVLVTLFMLLAIFYVVRRVE